MTSDWIIKLLSIQLLLDFQHETIMLIILKVFTKHVEIYSKILHPLYHVFPSLFFGIGRWLKGKRHKRHFQFYRKKKQKIDFFFFSFTSFTFIIMFKITNIKSLQYCNTLIVIFLFITHKN